VSKDQKKHWSHSSIHPQPSPRNNSPGSVRFFIPPKPSSSIVILSDFSTCEGSKTCYKILLCPRRIRMTENIYNLQQIPRCLCRGGYHFLLTGDLYIRYTHISEINISKMYKKTKYKPKETPVLVWKEGGLYFAQSLEVEVASQGSTKEESLATLKEMLEQYFAQELFIPRLFSDTDVCLEKLELSSV